MSKMNYCIYYTFPNRTRNISILPNLSSYIRRIVTSTERFNNLHVKDCKLTKEEKVQLKRDRITMTEEDFLKRFK